MRTTGVNRIYSSAMPWLLGAAVFVIGYSSDMWLPRTHGSEFIELSDDLVLAIVVGVVGSWWLKKRNRQMTEKLRRIANISHLIRNELEVIVCSAQATNRTANVKHIEQSVGQISWILRELLGSDYTTAAPAAPPQAQAAGWDAKRTPRDTTADSRRKLATVMARSRRAGRICRRCSQPAR